MLCRLYLFEGVVAVWLAGVGLMLSTIYQNWSWLQSTQPCHGSKIQSDLLAYQLQIVLQ